MVIAQGGSVVHRLLFVLVFQFDVVLVACVFVDSSLHFFLWVNCQHLGQWPCVGGLD